METTSRLIPATVETAPTLRVYLESTDDASRLADLTGFRVKVEQVYEPTSKCCEKMISRTATNEISRETVESSVGLQTLPEQVYKRITTSPERSFRVKDFLDLGNKKHINAILFRLAVKQKKIARGGRGEFQALSNAAAITVDTTGHPTSGPKILTYMKQHQGEWLHPKDVRSGMGLAADRLGAVTAALGRLAPKFIRKKGSLYGFFGSSQEEVDTR